MVKARHSLTDTTHLITTDRKIETLGARVPYEKIELITVIS